MISSKQWKLVIRNTGRSIITKKEKWSKNSVSKFSWWCHMCIMRIERMHVFIYAFDIFSLYLCLNTSLRYSLLITLTTGKSSTLLYISPCPHCGSVVKNLLAVQETQEMWVRSLGWEDPLEEGMATYSSIVHGVAKSQTWLKWLSRAWAHIYMYIPGKQINWGKHVF